jgi:hypothetical protein
LSRSIKKNQAARLAAGGNVELARHRGHDRFLGSGFSRASLCRDVDRRFFPNACGTEHQMLAVLNTNSLSGSPISCRAGCESRRDWLITHSSKWVSSNRVIFSIKHLFDLIREHRVEIVRDLDCPARKSNRCG